MICILTEGKGERKSGPELIRRILFHRLQEYEIQADNNPLSACGKGRLIKDFENLLRSLFKRPNCGGVLVLVDSDRCCAKELATGLSARARQLALGPVVVVCPVEEIENWFVCSAESICESSDPPADCEHHKSPKKWLDNCLEGGYRSTINQADLVWKIDFDLALPRSRSLQRMENAVSQLKGAIRDGVFVYTP